MARRLCLRSTGASALHPGCVKHNSPISRLLARGADLYAETFLNLSGGSAREILQRTALCERFILGGRQDTFPFRSTWMDPLGPQGFTWISSKTFPL